MVGDGSRVFVLSFVREEKRHWIPAFAGMTERGQE